MNLLHVENTNGTQSALSSQDACTISYDGLGGTYLVPVALMLEDHPSQTVTLDGSSRVTSSDPLSKVPLQFLVDGKT